jgi:hypothetical protein
VITEFFRVALGLVALSPPVCRDQGCQIFLAPKNQNGEKYTKLPQNIPNGHKIIPITII